MDKNNIKKCIDLFCNMLEEMIGEITSKDKILIVGLGNRHISSDSLGAKVVGKINITIDNKNLPKVMAIAPSVMGLTGIETLNIIEGVVSKVNPSHLIVIDSLCASSIERLGRSIQLTNTGICPGRGIGNNRKCIDNSLGPKVFAIGIPLLIYSSTFVSGTFEKYGLDFETINKLRKDAKSKDNNFVDLLDTIKLIIEDDCEEMIVSLKDIEECVTILSNIVAQSLNKFLGVNDIEY